MIDFRPIPQSIEHLPTGIYLLAKIKGTETIYEVAAHRFGGVVWEVDHAVILAKRFHFYAIIEGPIHE